ncbi:MAG: cardiolipin synthase, partial [Gammaproteobacteria bacterium]|nr:cardiolipin synthase [Gammaproteobacteria bacterium]MBT8109617.1 cardiolipin synthase [Gammaproteobacteria bacterium]NND46404.1 cardiolipin synthase [Woeseiaceae bacterium]NNL44320.1 cardiolipin synthase [Woeseiaceae bacterium]
MGWIMACLFIPYGGPVAYFIFGINRVRTRARGMRRPILSVKYEAGRSRAAISGAIGKGLDTVGQRITGRALSKGNAVDVYHNGEQAYPAMLASIESAKQQVLLATYILKTDRTGRSFADALGAAAARGVEVMVLIDGVGEMYSSEKPSKLLQRRGVNVGRFLPPRLIPPSIYVNLRNHRKLLVVDNAIAYAGGMNISDDHTTVPGKPRRVTDVHFSLRGPVVAELAAVFHDDWLFATGRAIKADERQVLLSDGAARCRVVPDGPDDQLDALALTIQGVVSGASDSIDIMTPYFLPSRELIASLQAAALRGIRIRVVLPAKNNLFYVHWANRNLLAELLEWGIEICYQPAPFCHSKLLCVDDEYCLIGSANLDPRSLRLNFELGVEIFSAPLSAELRAHIDEVAARSKPVTIEELMARSTPVRL